MYAAIMGFTCLMMILILYFNMKSASKIVNNIFMGVTLPKEVIESDLVNDLKLKYKKICNKYTLSMIITSLPIMFPIWIMEKSSINMIYFMAWTFIYMMYFMMKPFKDMNRKLKALKKENNWYAGEKKTVLVDTKTSMLKNKMHISSKYFIIPILLSILLIQISVSKKDDFELMLTLVAVFNLIMNIVIFFIFKHTNKVNLKVYSENSDINFIINKNERRLYSLYIIMSAIAGDLAFIIMYLAIFDYINISINITVILMIVMTCLVVIGFLYIRRKVDDIAEELIKNDDKEIVIDEDDYWIDGVYYYNENDKRTTVRGRFGTSSYTYNLASKGGKLAEKGTVILLAVILIPLFTMMLRMDFVDANMIVKRDEIRIKAPTYSFNFDIDNIESIELLDKYPKFNMRTNGAATGEYALGNFRSSEYGKSKVYLYYENPTCILIKLKSSKVKCVVYNDRDKIETEKLYNEIKSNIK